MSELPSKEDRSTGCVECARYESSRAVLTLLNDTQRDKIRELEAERDQYKQRAEQAELAAKLNQQTLIEIMRRRGVRS